MATFYLCMKIFLVRILDVSFGTVRTIITIKGKILIASIVGFFEILIWFLIVREALTSVDSNGWIAFSYSLGFATGTYIGGIISNRFIKSNLALRVITANDSLANIIRDKGYGVSVINIKGKDEIKEKYMLLIEISNKSLDSIKRVINKNDKNAFCMISETRYVQNGFFK